VDVGQPLVAQRPQEKNEGHGRSSSVL